MVRFGGKNCQQFLYEIFSVGQKHFDSNNMQPTHYIFFFLPWPLKCSSKGLQCTSMRYFDYIYMCCNGFCVSIECILGLFLASPCILLIETVNNVDVDEFKAKFSSVVDFLLLRC